MATFQTKTRSWDAAVAIAAAKNGAFEQIEDGYRIQWEGKRDRQPIKEGDTVMLKPEWQDAGDDNYHWIACHDEEADSDRILITPININMAIKPTYLVKLEWLDFGDNA